MTGQITISKAQFFEFLKYKNEDEESSSPKYFLKYFDNYKNTGEKASVNWAAFFFVDLWFLHRKMYVYGISILLFLVVFGFSADYLKNFLFSTETLQANMIFSGSFALVSIALRLLLMVYSNYIYLRFADKKIKAGIFSNGTNMLVVWFVFACNLIMLIPEPILLFIKTKLLAIFHFG